jgi:hypothetical protein
MIQTWKIHNFGFVFFLKVGYIGLILWEHIFLGFEFKVLISVVWLFNFQSTFNTKYFFKSKWKPFGFGYFNKKINRKTSSFQAF